jgi:hypothetical protein
MPDDARPGRMIQKQVLKDKVPVKSRFVEPNMILSLFDGGMQTTHLQRKNETVLSARFSTS